jgi:hypothetical protein
MPVLVYTRSASYVSFVNAHAADNSMSSSFPGLLLERRGASHDSYRVLVDVAPLLALEGGKASPARLPGSLNLHIHEHRALCTYARVSAYKYQCVYA